MTQEEQQIVKNHDAQSLVTVALTEGIVIIVMASDKTSASAKIVNASVSGRLSRL